MTLADKKMSDWACRMVSVVEVGPAVAISKEVIWNFSQTLKRQVAPPLTLEMRNRLQFAVTRSEC